MRISDWSSDVCSSDLAHPDQGRTAGADEGAAAALLLRPGRQADRAFRDQGAARPRAPEWPGARGQRGRLAFPRSEEHTSELQSLMRISYAVFCLKKKNTNKRINK